MKKLNNKNIRGHLITNQQLRKDINTHSRTSHINYSFEKETNAKSILLSVLILFTFE